SGRGQALSKLAEAASVTPAPPASDPNGSTARGGVRSRSLRDVENSRSRPDRGGGDSEAGSGSGGRRGRSRGAASSCQGCGDTGGAAVSRSSASSVTGSSRLNRNPPSAERGGAAPG